MDEEVDQGVEEEFEEGELDPRTGTANFNIKEPRITFDTKLTDNVGENQKRTGLALFLRDMIAI